MKRSKILKIVCSILLCFTVCFAFMGCDVAENTKEAIDAATSILPVEYSENLARNVLKAAITTSYAQKNILVVDDYIDYNDGLKQRVEQLKRMKIENEDGFINEYQYQNQTLPSSYISEMWRIENTEGDRTYTKSNAGETKTYEDSSTSLMVHCFNDVYLLDESMVSIILAMKQTLRLLVGDISMAMR